MRAVHEEQNGSFYEGVYVGFIITNLKKRILETIIIGILLCLKSEFLKSNFSCFCMNFFHLAKCHYHSHACLYCVAQIISHICMRRKKNTGHYIAQSFILNLILKFASLLSAIKFYRMAMQLVPDIEFKVNYSHPSDADADGGK